MTITFDSWPLMIFFGIIAIAYLILGVVYVAVWLDILRIKLTDPERYARFVDLRRARKGK